MKAFVICFMKILNILILTLITSASFSQHNPVVIELFTSQGCSSCPAADKNLAEIIEDAEKNGQPVYGLSFHVDYWNYIGWKDPYSKPDYTARQRQYAQKLNSESVYTPQMIVNGEVEFVGSNKKASSDAIARALSKKMPYRISLNNIQQKEGKIFLSYSLDNIPNEATVNAAIVERNVENNVSRGENSGRKLAHKNVVRSFVSAQLQKSGELVIEFPSGISASSVIVFIQDKEFRITGASFKNIK